MLVETTNASKRLRVKVSEFGKIVGAGLRFEVSEERYKLLSGDNKYKTRFVKLVEEAKPVEVKVEPEKGVEPTVVVIEPEKVEPVVEEEVKPKKRSRKKKAEASE